MFTGIVEETGRVAETVLRNSAMRLKIECLKVLDDLKTGDSVAVNGVCLTAVSLGVNFFTADLSYETLERSSLSSIRAGHIVNLERALTLSSRLGGHIVQGHIDGKGRLLNVSKAGGSYKVTFGYPPHLDKYMVPKCSVAVDGISLTAADIKGGHSFETAVIPHTFENTCLKYKKNGDFVNLEIDIFAKYVEKLLTNTDKDDILKSLLSGLIRC